MIISYGCQFLKHVQVVRENLGNLTCKLFKLCVCATTKPNYLYVFSSTNYIHREEDLQEDVYQIYDINKAYLDAHY